MSAPGEYMRLDTWFPAVAALVMGACQCGGPAAPCGPGTCAGCCFANECFPGDWNSACGTDGEACRACNADGRVCFRPQGQMNRLCVLPGPGGSIGFGGGRVDAGVDAGAGGGMAPLPGINDTYGSRCSAQSGCSAYAGEQLSCLEVVRSTGAFSVCQFGCNAQGCALGGRCIPQATAIGVCVDCVRPCNAPSGQQENCEYDELCTMVSGQPGCVPDCRLRGARCPMGSTCRPDGLCSPEPIRRCENF